LRVLYARTTVVAWQFALAKLKKKLDAVESLTYLLTPDLRGEVAMARVLEDINS